MFARLSLLCLTVVEIVAFNIDTHYPVIYSDPKGENGSYFGYSSVLIPRISDKSRRSIKVGAPKANGISDHSGQVYECEWLGRMSCTAVRYSNMSKNDEWKNSFLGGAMDISDNYNSMVACAYRKATRKRNENDESTGICYGTDLNINRLEELEFKELRSSLFGFSVAFVPNSRESEVLIGAPVYNDAAGTFFRFKYSSQKSFLKDEAEPPSNSYSSNTMSGYSFTSGYIGLSNTIHHAVGRPKGRNGRGEVEIFNNLLERIASIKGEKDGEYFGASVSSGRILGNKQTEELVIGSPYYNEDGYKLYNMGRVSVYNVSRVTKRFQAISVLYGKSMNGQFGAALMFLDDIDSDGFDDIAIAAPYENDGAGVVYIHRGLGYKEVISKSAAQVIEGQSVYKNLRGFGVSISRLADLDENGYKDIAIGAHVSGHLVILRSKPIVVVTCELLHEPNIVKMDSKNVTLLLNFTFSEFRNETLDIKYNVQVEQVNFTKDFNYTIQKDISNVKRIIVDLKNITNQATSILAMLSYDLVQSNAYAKGEPIISNPREGNDLLDIRSPVLDPFRSSNKNMSIMIPILRECGSDDICTSNLTIVSIYVIQLSKSNVFVVGSNNTIKLLITLANNGEHAYNAYMQVMLSQEIVFDGDTSHCKRRKGRFQLTDCYLGNPFRNNTQKTIDLDIDVSSIDKIYTLKKLEIKLEIKSLNSTIRGNYVIPLSREADIALIRITDLGNSYLENNTNRIVNFTQNFNVEREGFSTIETVRIKMEIPFRYNEIQFLEIYHPKATFFEDMKCNTTLPFAEKLSNETQNPEVKRARREVQEIPTDQLQNSTIKFNNTLFILKCDSASVECLTLECEFGPYAYGNPPVTIELEMMFNVHAIEDVSDDSIWLTSKVFANIKSPTGMVQRRHRPHMIELSHLFQKPAPTKTIGFWYIILAILLTVVLLIILVVVLVKMGFFKRKVKEELDLLKAQVEIEGEDKFDPNTAYEEITIRNSVVMSELVNNSTEGLCK